jgi:hypothetical protein
LLLLKAKQEWLLFQFLMGRFLVTYDALMWALEAWLRAEKVLELLRRKELEILMLFSRRGYFGIV